MTIPANGMNSDIHASPNTARTWSVFWHGERLPKATA